AYPEGATYDGDHRFDDRLTDLSHEAAEIRCQKQRSFQRALKRINPALLSAAGQLNYHLFAQMIRAEIQAHELGLHLMAIDQQEGIHLRFPQLVEIQPLQSYAQYQQYFSRLRSFAKQVQDTIANLRLGLERGLILPRTVVTQSLEQMRELAECPLEQMPLYEPIRRHAHELPPDLAKRVETMARRLIAQAVQPAYAQLHAFVASEYLPYCRQSDGLWGLATGAEIYQYWVERHAGPGFDAEEIHQLGRQEVARLLQSLQPLLRELGLPTEPRQILEHLSRRESSYYTDADKMLKDYQQMFDRAQAVLPKLFKTLPRTPCELKEIEAWRAAAAPQAYYYPPPQDLSRPGVFYVNTHDLPSRPRYSMMALTLHEAVPGHHLQLARALEIPHQPAFRYHLEATAFVEGWALYAEALGHPLGLYEDPLQALGALSFELWRACRLVVDTGLHALQWTREEAVCYFREHTLQSETDIQSEIDRYLSLPAQALAYKIGELRIWQLRKEAECNLGQAFDLGSFHEALLSQGSVPLSALDEHMAEWLSRQRLAASG
ncbi:MAG: DUF885 domain-containing protein, partial [Candidatus Melainabacteria bacterium HGW-Melainabacteria-1]